MFYCPRPYFQGLQRTSMHLAGIQRASGGHHLGGSLQPLRQKRRWAYRKKPTSIPAGRVFQAKEGPNNHSLPQSGSPMRNESRGNQELVSDSPPAIRSNIKRCFRDTNPELCVRVGRSTQHRASKPPAYRRVRSGDTPPMYQVCAGKQSYGPPAGSFTLRKSYL